MITDDLKKTNMQVCQFIEDTFKHYDELHFQNVQQHLNTLAIFSDNCGYQFKSRLINAYIFGLIIAPRLMKKLLF